MHVIFDTQVAVVDLKAAGFDERQAQTIVTVIKNSQNELATKQDIIQLELRIVIKLGMAIFVSFGLFAGLLAYIVK